MQLMRKYKILKFLIGIIKEDPEDLDELFNLLGELRGVPQKFGQFLYLKDQEKYYVFEKLLDEGIPFKDSFLYARAKELCNNNISLEEKPMASASIGQVYGGDFKGEAVIVKIQYPEIQRNMDHDFRFMKKILGFFFGFFRFPQESKMLLMEYLKEFEETFQVEVDYTLEGAQHMKFYEFFSHQKQIFIPKVYNQFTQKDILVEERCKGVPLKVFLKQPIEEYEKKEALQLLFTFYFQSFFKHGILHGDPHSGNFFVRRDKKGLILEVVDFGCVKDYGLDYAENIKQLILYLKEESYRPIPALLLQLGFKEDEITAYGKALVPILNTIFEPFLLDEDFDFEYWKLTYTLNTIMGSKVFEKTLSLPKELLILFRVFHGCIAHVHALEEKTFNVYRYLEI